VLDRRVGLVLRLKLDSRYSSAGVTVPSTIMMTGLSTFKNALTLADILSPPEILEPIRLQLRVAHGMLDILVPKPSVQGAGVVTRIAFRETSFT
jgi:hypothetical protein